MARIRTIKPEFFTSEDIVALSPFARLLFIAIWCEADRDGRLIWKPKTFKMRYLPADQLDINLLCEELVIGGLVRLYGEGLAYIPTFLKHQHINPREAESKLPDHYASGTREPRVNVATMTRREEGKGKEHIDNASNFDAFWSAYPKKSAKIVAEKAWGKARINGDFTNLMDALAEQTLSEQWQKDAGKYIPNPATWINQRRWEDETPKFNQMDIMQGVI
ncbi:MAG: hypothetical protein PHO76_12655 [Methylotenera sp.]|nr:hypothetical protein [Methylotenera sp.]MDD4926816.1 hypothetical protein [Methylotenera sp.]